MHRESSLGRRTFRERTQVVSQVCSFVMENKKVAKLELHPFQMLASVRTITYEEFMIQERLIFT